VDHVAPRAVVEDRDFLVLWKPDGMHAAPNREGDKGTLLDWILEHYPEIRTLPGRKPQEHGLVQRLDRDTRGLVVCARNEAAFRGLLELSRWGRFEKSYSALCRAGRTPPPGLRSFLPQPSGAFPWVLRSRFRAYGPGGRLVVAIPAIGTEEPRVSVSSTVFGRKISKLYETEIDRIEETTQGVHIRALIRRGFRHQIRVHLASIGFPIAGDPLYLLPADAPGTSLHLAAIEVCFPHPRSGAITRIAVDDPWA